jgi:16S rRNA (guanine527-N7)-methyltransferase
VKHRTGGASKSDEASSTVIRRALDDAGMMQPDRVVDGLAIHLDAVLEANKIQSLTTIADVESASRLHVVDSLTALPEVEAAPFGRLVDLGSGTGYPGIPLALVTGRETVLVESVAKKARFLEDVSRRLKDYCDITVEHARAESAVPACGAFAVATARAVSSLASLVELAAPFLVERGRLVALKGPLSDDELERGKVAADMVGMELGAVRELCLPGGENRSIVVFERTCGLPRISVPRTPGKAQRKPLA